MNCHSKSQVTSCQICSFHQNEKQNKTPGVPLVWAQSMWSQSGDNTYVEHWGSATSHATANMSKWQFNFIMPSVQMSSNVSESWKLNETVCQIYPLTQIFLSYRFDKLLRSLKYPPWCPISCTVEADMLWVFSRGGWENCEVWGDHAMTGHRGFKDGFERKIAISLIYFRVHNSQSA